MLGLEFLDADFEGFELLFQGLDGALATGQTRDPILKTGGARQAFPTDDDGDGPEDEFKGIVPAWMEWLRRRWPASENKVPAAFTAGIELSAVAADGYFFFA